MESDWGDILAYHIGLREMMLKHLPTSYRGFRSLTGSDVGESEATPSDVEKESPESVNVRPFAPPESRHFIRDDSPPPL